jgi:hypothetical protein
MRDRLLRTDDVWTKTTEWLREHYGHFDLAPYSFDVPGDHFTRAGTTVRSEEMVV